MVAVTLPRVTLHSLGCYRPATMPGHLGSNNYAIRPTSGINTNTSKLNDFDSSSNCFNDDVP